MAKTDKTKTLSENLFPVVGIGASAGGLSAFKSLIKAIPVDSGMAYVLVQHLDPTHESVLPEILQKVTPIPVLEITDDIKVKPDHIYILPSNKMLIANDGVLELSPRVNNKNERNLPIDLFFNSLAEVHQSHAIGVVLSGTGSDGTVGLRKIKDHGGITIAQDVDSAAYDGMPKSAMLAGVVDFIMPPDEIPLKLSTIAKSIYQSDIDKLENGGPLPDFFQDILKLLRLRRGTDFTYYKQSTIRRRILRRMALNKIEEHAEYYKYLSDNKPEQDILYQDLLIPVTSFFRDTKIFTTFCDTVLPQILKNKTTAEPVRIWVPGCSTGQEAYSIAMCLKEFMNHGDADMLHRKVQIFATDISEPAILKARGGIYATTEMEGIDSQRHQDFFTKNNGGFQINKQIREMCVFATHNFVKDPPFGKMDLISCRNVLIYMEPYLQKKALTTFHYSLNPKGILWLGKTESIAGVPDLFISLQGSDKMFTRKDVPGKFMYTTSARHEQSLQSKSPEVKNTNTRTDFQQIADEIMLTKYTPGGVVVNESLDIVHYRGITKNYLEQSTGKPSHNLIVLAKEGLGFELRSLLQKVKKENAHKTKENIPIIIEGHIQNVTIEAFPLPDTIDPHYLVLFYEDFTPGNPSQPYKVGGSLKTSYPQNTPDERDARIQQLEKDLAQSRIDMRAITEEQEAINEELQSANEELLSGSEELQSLNEELESSKEELQSTNEELTVVNQEMIGLNEQISEARDYAEAIVSNLRRPLIVLNKHLRIKSANSAFYKTFLVNELETEGNLIYEIGNKDWDIPDLRVLLEQVLPQKQKLTDFEVRHTFQSIGPRIMLLNAHEITSARDLEKTILLDIEDVTEKNQYLQKEKELLNRFHNIVMQAPVSICIMKGPELIVEMANPSFLLMVDKKEKDIIGKSIFSSIPESKTLAEPILHEVMKTGVPFHGNEFEFNITRFGKPEICYFNFVYQPLKEIDGSIATVIFTANEVTEQVLARKLMEAQAAMVENLLLTAPAFVCTLTGPDHVYDLINQRYQELFGKRKLKGKPVMIALPELAGQGFDVILDNVYKTGETFVGIELPILLARDEHLEPEVRYFNLSYQPIYDAFKNIFSILVFGYEVTEHVISRLKNLETHKMRGIELEEQIQIHTLDLKQTNELLKIKNKELVSSNKELRSFNYISSHDLQEPLRKIQTFASRILQKEHENLSEIGKGYFLRMQQSANRMQSLIVDLLSFSRISSLDQPIEFTNVNYILEEVILDLGETIREKKAIIELDQLCDLRVIPFQFRQIVYNLLGNSLKFSSSDRPPHIRISSAIENGASLKFEIIDPEQSFCRISFSDNGIGFDPQYKDLIFELFKRLHGQNEYEGTGIGLSIVKKIVENHQGYVTAIGEVGKGATFNIYLPAQSIPG